MLRIRSLATVRGGEGVVEVGDESMDEGEWDLVEADLVVCCRRACPFSFSFCFLLVMLGSFRSL